MTSKISPPGSTIGILGGGQLGRMMAMAAARLGYHVHIYCPDAGCPAAEVAQYHTARPYDDMAALETFARAVDVITFEFENVPLTAAQKVAESTPIYPSPETLEICQHRLKEKKLLGNLGIATAPFMGVNSVVELKAAIEKIGTPAILKTCREGYDGKGQVRINDISEAESAFESLKTDDAALEGFVNFDREISVIIARNNQGETACYPPVHNVHKNHILHQTFAPADMHDELRDEAIATAHKIADALGLVGILAVEMFVTADSKIIINELAPRPHNSGHWTMEACAISQFEMTIRAVCGLPLPAIGDCQPAVMTNLIGDNVDAWQDYLKEPNTHLHLYGKKEVKAGRKMGHVTQLVIPAKAGTHAMQQAYCSSWKLNVIGEPTETYSSLLYPVNYEKKPAMLKCFKPHSDEKNSAAVLRYYDGNGAVKLLKSSNDAILIEQLRPGDELTALTKEGKDDEATKIFCDVANQLHEAQIDSRAFKDVSELEIDFDHYLAKGLKAIPEATIHHAKAEFNRLANTQGQKVLLHGDLHHYNILFDQQHGWVAIDPKGYVGEAEYEVGAYLRNPITSDVQFYEAITRERLDIICAKMQLDWERTLRWAYVQAVLAVTYTDSEPDGDLFRKWLAFAEMLKGMIVNK